MQKYLDALKRIDEITNHKCFLNHGTLLGCIREGKMIDGDSDLDIGILEEDYKEEFLDKIINAFGDTLIRKWGEDALMPKGTAGKIGKIKIYEPNLCFNIWRKGIDGNRYFPFKDNRFLFKALGKFMKKFKEVDFMGLKVMIPTNAEEYLAWNYGDGWKIPDPEFTYDDSPAFIRNRLAVILAAQKEDIKWGSHLGIPKQLIEFNGETLIGRIIRQLKIRGFNVAITLPEKHYLGNYDSLGVREIICDTRGDAIEKLLSLKNETPCVAIYGDTYFTDYAMDLIKENKEDLMYFGREGKSEITGKPFGEPFAINLNSFLIEQAQEMKNNKMFAIIGGKRRLGEWELYRYINKSPLDKHIIKDYWTEINDETDDIDFPKDYDKMKLLLEGKKKLSHVVISRMWYSKEEDLLERIKIYEANLLPVLLNQKDQDFDIAILCNKKHESIIKGINPRIIPFFTKKKPSKKGKFWHINSEWEDISGLKKYDIQSNIDSDDTVSLDYTKIVVEELSKVSVSTLINFQPVLRDFYTGENKPINHIYGEKWFSAFYSIYQPDKKDYIYIGKDEHLHFNEYVEKTITIPEGHAWVNLHDKNDSSQMSKLLDKKRLKDKTHVIVTRMHYKNVSDLLKRIEIYKKGLLKNLLNQEDKNFDIGVLCRKEHEQIIRNIHPRIIPFFTDRDGWKVDKCWALFIEWRDIYGLGKYDIQTNVDSDDLVSPQFTKIIRQALVGAEVSTHIHFAPMLKNHFTGEIKSVRDNYFNGNKSAFYSLYQPDKEDYIYIGQDSHTKFSKYAERSILIPEGEVWVQIHDSNDSSTMESLGKPTPIFDVNNGKVEKLKAIIKKYKEVHPEKYKKREKELMAKLNKLL